MSKKDLIPVEKLQEGFDNCVKHIRSLIASSELLYSNQMYPAALALAVLAIEEDAKLGVIREHIRDKKPVQQSEWQDLIRGGSHKTKLIMQLQKERIMMKAFPPQKHESIRKFNEHLGVAPVAFEVAQRDNPQDYVRFQLLDTMKQDCFYMGWKRNDWLSFSSILTMEEQEAMVWLLLKQAKSWLLIKIIANKYPDPVRSVDYVKLKEDSIVAELIALNKEFGTPIFIGKNLLLAQAMTKYRKAQS